MKSHEIKPFKQREVNLSKLVRVYRCLNRKGVVFSVWQEGKVVGHTSCLAMENVIFKISKAGQDKCREKGMRNVHAFVEGSILLNQKLERKDRIRYNPYRNDFFYLEDYEDIKQAERVEFTNEGLFLIK